MPNLIRAFARTRKLIQNRWRQMKGPRLVPAQNLSDRAFLARFKVAEVSAALARNDVPAAKEALLAHYERRIGTHWPAFPRKITDMELDLAELSRAELIRRAGSLLEQGQIDWHSNPTGDQERLWWLNRQPWWPVLATAYAQTGDERYATAFVSQLLDWLKVNPPPGYKNEKSPSWRLMEVGLRLRVSWLPSLAVFYKSPAFTAAAKLKMLRSIYDHARFLYLFQTNRNHLLRESNGLAFVSTYLPEFNEAPLWQQTALERFDRELANQFNQDGSHIEVSTGYQWLVIDEFQHVYDLLQAHNLSLPQSDLGSWLEKMYHVLAYLIRPDGAFPQVNDGYIYYTAERLTMAGEMFERDDFVYIGSGGGRGTVPAQTSTAFPDAGLYVMRSDWIRQDHYLLFDAGPYGGPHGHEDKLSFELCAYGQPFIVDPGSYTYFKADPFRNYFVGSEGHNTVLVDGRSQVRRWRQENWQPRPAPGNYAAWISRPDFDYVAATYTDGYGDFELERPADPAMITDVAHTRRILFVKPDYWLIVDELHASKPHTYQLLFHTMPEITVRSEPDNRVVLTGPGETSLHVIPAGPGEVTVSCVAGSEAPIQGWYSAGSRHKVPATTVIYDWAGTSSVVFATLLYPCPTAQGNGRVASLTPLALSSGRGSAYSVVTPRGTDYLMFSPDDSLKQFGPYESRSTLVCIRTDAEQKVVNRFEWREK